MNRSSSLQYWNEIVITAYRSGEQLRHWCQEHGVNEKNFHRWANKLGYTENGKRTEKYYSLMDGSSVDEASEVVVTPVFVEVPPQTLENFREPANAVSYCHPLITIDAGRYQIGIRDGFSEQTLSKVLEVVRYA